ncbi:hypothetical protein GCM10009624_05290 [Gordonia sinesedis]
MTTLRQLRAGLARVARAAVSTRARALMCIGLLIGLGAVGTLAKWNDEAVATSGTIATGNIDIRANDVKRYTFGQLGMTGMRPGNSKAANLTVGNRGSIPLTYTTRVTGSGTLAPYLQVTAYAGGTAINANSVGTCTGGTPIGTAKATNGSSVPVVTAARPVGATTGADPLCFVATLSTSAPFSASNTTGTLAFDFAGTST